MLASPRNLGCLVVVMLLALTAPWTNAVALAAAAQCELVELYPGYPGYQGFVTGVDGVGDYACLEDLESADATFSKSRQDRLNREAAEELDITGSMDVWTWENWLAIEAERGLTPTCYYCAFAAAEARPEPRDVPRDPSDPRLLAGRFGETTINQRYFEERDMISRFAYQWEDYQLRALAGLAFPSDHPNAEQLLDYI